MIFPADEADVAFFLEQRHVSYKVTALHIKAVRFFSRNGGKQS